MKTKETMMKKLNKVVAKKLGIVSVVLSMLVLVCGCTPAIKLNGEQQAYIDKVMKEPLSVAVSASEAETAWGRANTFVARYASMKIQVSNDYVIETYNPTDGKGFLDFNYGYSVSKVPVKDGFVFEVSGMSSGGNLAKGKTARNAHIFAYYIRTGELPYPELIAR
jgi:hypothetical protein